MQEAGLTDAQMKGAMAGVFVFTVILSFLMGFFLQYVTIHQFGAVGMIGGDEMNANPSYHAFMKDYGTAYRSFGHGALHSLMAGVFFVFPNGDQCHVRKKILEVHHDQHRILDFMYYHYGRNYLRVARCGTFLLGNSKIILTV